MNRYYGWSPYVPVAVRRARALKKTKEMQKKGIDIQPVEIKGRTIAQTFWGKAWCDHLESFSDYDNRLPRGRTYVRNRSVCHLKITKGKIDAMVSGSELYQVKIDIKTFAPKKWKGIKDRCGGKVGSLIELLQGRLSGNVMEIVTDQNKGLFPHPKEIELQCNCPDWATMCKHVAAVLYGVGARLDEKPELLFLLRGVDHLELINNKISMTTATGKAKGGRRRIAEDAVADVFGIEMPTEMQPAKPEPSSRRKKATKKRTSKNPTGKKTVKKKAAKKKSVVTKTHKAKLSKGAVTTQGKKKPVATKSVSNRLDQNGHPVTAKIVFALRTKFGMSRSQFARLLGVSLPSISNWENKSNGTLSLQPRTHAAWNSAKRLSKKQAWKQLATS